MRKLVLIATAVAALAAPGVASATAGPATASGGHSAAKAIWGPLTVGGKSEFPAYRALGAGIYQMDLKWAAAAPTAPTNATDPRDPAYQWPADVSYAIQQAARYHMRVSLLVTATPSWANGGRWEDNYPPTQVSALAQFLTAASRHYPSVHLWMIWGEPNRHGNFAIVTPVPGRSRSLTRAQTLAPHVYAQMLDASYGALKAVSARNLIIGGDTFTWGNISDKLWIENLRLPNGRPPRMDLYGHNPFSYRDPNLANRPSPYGAYDFSDLARLSRLVNSNLAIRGHQIKLFLSEWTIPTTQADREFNFWVTPSVQARWIRDGWRIVRRSSFIYALGWVHLLDDPVLGISGGLLDYLGHPKPGYYAFKNG